MAASYVTKMQAFRSGDDQAATSKTLQRKSNPMRVAKSYKKQKRLNADLTRYYEDCTISKSAKRFTGARKKSYCAGVAWKRARRAGRYKDYPAFGRKPMAGKSRNKSSAARKRKRNKRTGRFMEPGSKMRENPHTRASRKRAGKKAAATRKRNKSAKIRARAAAKKRTVKKRPAKKRTAKRRTVVRKRKTSRPRTTRKSSARKRTRKSVPRTVINVMEARTPMKRRRRRKSRKHTAREEMLENPHTRASRKRAGKKAAATRRRNKLAKQRKRKIAAVCRTRAKTATRSSGRSRKRSGARRSAGVTLSHKEVKALIARSLRGGSSKKKGRKKGKKRGPRAKKAPLGLPAAYPGMTSAPTDFSRMGEGALENPLSGGEIALALVTGGIGYTLTDVVDRYLATKKTASVVENQAMILAAPSLTRMAVQAGMAIAPFALANMVHQPMGRAALQGFGLGAGLHLFGQVVRTYLIGKYLKSNATVQQLMPETISSQAMVDAMPNVVSGLPSGVGRSPRMLGAKAPYGVGATDMVYGDTNSPTRAPVMSSSTNVTTGGAPVMSSSTNVTTGGAPVMSSSTTYPGGAGMPVAQVLASSGCASVDTAHGVGNSQNMIPVYSAGAVIAASPSSCTPQSAETPMAALQNAYSAAVNAARNEANSGCCGTPPMKTKLTGMFPDN